MEEASYLLVRQLQLASFVCHKKPTYHHVIVNIIIMGTTVTKYSPLLNKSGVS